MFLRGDVYTLLNMLVRDCEEQKEASLVYDLIKDDDVVPSRVSRHEKILALHERLLQEGKGPRDWLLANIKAVISKVEVQVLKLKQSRDSKNKKLNIQSKTKMR